MAGDRVTDETKAFLIGIYDSLKHQTGKKPSGQHVLDVAKASLAAKPQTNVFLPALRKVQYIVGDITPDDNLTPDEKTQQKDWTLGTLTLQLLPAESVPHVMLMWRYSRHADEKFTIRQAKWVSRLYQLVPGLADLWAVSYMYAKKEELSMRSHIAFNTLFDDMSLSMNTLEMQTFLEAQKNTTVLVDKWGMGIPFNYQGLVIEEALHPFDYYNSILNRTASNQRYKELVDSLIKLPSLYSLHLKLPTIMIYISWFTHIRKTQEWPKITADQALAVIHKLREWATKEQPLLEIDGQERTFKVERATKGHQLSFVQTLPKPEQALKLLSECAHKGGKK